MKMEAKGKKGSPMDEEELEAMNMDIPRKLYCEDVFGGFRASAKLESIIEDYQALPANDKVLICSFFKGSLDLLEAIFHDMGVSVARFDGDVGSEERQMQLDRFKEEESCRVLLLTVQTGGTGLNLVNANHVWFVDRFWNPMVMEQAEDRCYRIGQKKNVDVTYHDVSYTTDDVMRHINEAKTENATILLGDGSKLSTSTSGMSFKDISGDLGNAVRGIRDARMVFVTANKQRIYDPLPPSPEGLIDAATSGISSGAQTLSRYNSILEAVAGMLGFALPPRANPSTTTTNPSTEHGSVPMEIDVGTSGLDSKPPARQVHTKSESADNSGAEANANATESKSSVKAKNESNIGTLEDTDVINQLEDDDEEEEESKPAARPSLIDLDSDSDEEEDSLPKKAKKGGVAGIGGTSVKAESKVKAEPVASAALAKAATAKPQQQPTLLLDDDSDDDSILDTLIFKGGKGNKKAGK